MIPLYEQQQNAVSSKLENYIVTTNDSKFNDVKQIIGNDKYTDGKPYLITNTPTADSNYIQSGRRHTILGLEYDGQKYGYQVSYGTQKILYRTKNNNVWSEWQYLTPNIKDYDLFTASSTIKSLRIKGLEIGGIYSIAFSYNFNTVGNSLYRATVYAILSIPCGYNWSTSQVIVRPKLQIISNYSQTGIEADSNIKIVCEGGGTEISANSFVSSPYLYLYFTNGSLDNFNVKIEKIN